MQLINSASSATIVYIIYLSMCLVSATLTPKSPKGAKDSKAKTEKVRLGPQNYTVFDRNLVTEHPVAKNIISNCQAYFAKTSDYKLDGLVLGYVTPVSI